MSNPSNQDSAESLFGNVISTYTRAQAIEDAIRGNSDGVMTQCRQRPEQT